MKMKKIFTMAAAAVLAVGVLAGCNNADQTAKNAEGGQQEKATFTVGFDQDFPPFGYVGEDGKFTGFDLELAAEVAKRLDYTIKYQPIEWSAKDLELSSGAIDCIWNGFTMTGREDGYTWSEPYMNNEQIFVVRTKDGISSYADLAGKIVTAQADSAALRALQEEENKALLDSFKQLVECGQYNAAFMDLEAGAVDAIAMDIGVAKYQIKGKEAEYKILDESLMTEQYAVGFKQGNTELRDKVQETLEKMTEDGTFAEISNKWFGSDVGIIGK